MHQDQYKTAKTIVKKDACMNCNDMARCLYLETNSSSIGLRAKLLQVRDGMNCGCDATPDNIILCPMAFTSKSLSSAEQHYSNIEHEVLRILHGFEKIHHYCFIREVCIITDHKPLLAILSTDVAMLSQ